MIYDGVIESEAHKNLCNILYNLILNNENCSSIYKNSVLKLAQNVRKFRPDVQANHLDHDHELNGPKAGKVRGLLCNLYNAQNGKCLICQRELNPDVQANHLDHDHELNGPSAALQRLQSNPRTFPAFGPFNSWSWSR